MNGGFTCGGYTRERHFIHVSSNSPQTRWHTLWQPGKQSLSTTTCTRRLRSKTLEQEPEPEQPPDDTSSSPPEEAQLLVPEVEQPSSTVPLRSQFLSHFIDVFLPSPNETVDRGNIISALPSLLGESKLLDDAITAVSTIFLGITNHDLRLKQDAMRLYSSTLQGMLRAILRSSKPSDDLLHTSVVLGYYEVRSRQYLLHNFFNFFFFFLQCLS